MQTQNKRDQLLKAVKIEIDKKNHEINLVYMEMGKNMYQIFTGNGIVTIENPQIQSNLDDLKQKHIELENLNLKYDEIDRKYTEELQILSASSAAQSKMVNTNVSPVAEQTLSMDDTNSSGQILAAFCSACGTKKEGENLFCSNCGNKF